LSKIKPLSVDKTLPGHPDPTQVKGRIITLEFESCYVIGTYVMNAGQNLKVFSRVAEYDGVPNCARTRHLMPKMFGMSTLQRTFEI
jgi:exonuclease III